MKNRLLDPTIGALNTSLNLRLLRHNVISSNLANADTPGYKAKEMEFEQAFREILGASDNGSVNVTSSRHIAARETDPVFPEIYENPNGVENLDGNTVDRADEMAKMVENQALYTAAVEMLRKKLGAIKYAIEEGGGS
jgi:flagellar basal-body rod protein FlgB